MATVETTRCENGSGDVKNGTYNVIFKSKCCMVIKCKINATFW